MGLRSSRRHESVAGFCSGLARNLRYGHWSRLSVIMTGSTEIELPDYRSFAPMPGGSLMPSTDSQRIEFSSLNARTVTSDFEGGQITSDGGVTLLGEVDRMYRVIERLADCRELIAE